MITTSQGIFIRIDYIVHWNAVKENAGPASVGKNEVDDDDDDD